jgi:hypothetical protein
VLALLADLAEQFAGERPGGVGEALHQLSLDEAEEPGDLLQKAINVLAADLGIKNAMEALDRAYERAGQGRQGRQGKREMQTSIFEFIKCWQALIEPQNAPFVVLLETDAPSDAQEIFGYLLAALPPSKNLPPVRLVLETKKVYEEKKKNSLQGWREPRRPPGKWPDKQPICIGPLTRPEAELLVQGEDDWWRARWRRPRFECEGKPKTIVRWAGCHPTLLQLVCHTLDVQCPPPAHRVCDVCWTSHVDDIRDHIERLLTDAEWYAIRNDGWRWNQRMQNALRSKGVLCNDDGETRVAQLVEFVIKGVPQMMTLIGLIGEYLRKRLQDEAENSLEAVWEEVFGPDNLYIAALEEAVRRVRARDSFSDIGLPEEIDVSAVVRYKVDVSEVSIAQLSDAEFKQKLRNAFIVWLDVPQASMYDYRHHPFSSFTETVISEAQAIYERALSVEGQEQVWRLAILRWAVESRQTTAQIVAMLKHLDSRFKDLATPEEAVREVGMRVATIAQQRGLATPGVEYVSGLVSESDLQAIEEVIYHRQYGEVYREIMSLNEQIDDADVELRKLEMRPERLRTEDEDKRIESLRRKIEQLNDRVNEAIQRWRDLTQR